MLNHHTEVSKSLYHTPLLFAESHTEENPISSSEIFLLPYVRAGHGRTKFLNIMDLIKIAQIKRMYRAEFQWIALQVNSSETSLTSQGATVV
jgi:hypothetical protein